MNPLLRGIKTIQQIGWQPVLQLALYRFGLITGHYRRLTVPGDGVLRSSSTAWLDQPQPLDESEVAKYFREHPELTESCLKEADLILSGKCHIFGSQLVDIFWDDLDFTRHWTDYERGHVLLPEKDIKFIWEPARLGWVFSLVRAKLTGNGLLSGPQVWALLEKFLTKNPVNCGPNWMNGQEVALRILALVFFHEAFCHDPDMPENWEQILAQAVIDHARRIPPTLVYARSQQNNHLLVEAAGLYTAGVFLPDYPESQKWKETGWDVFHQALDHQIQADGTYAQYSTNYHRLMLQIALWMKAVSLRAGEEFPERSTGKLAAATQWLAGLTAPETGRVPNYGHNDGAYIIPLTGCPFNDYRPVLQSAQHFFLPGTVSEAADEMPLWFEWLSGKPADTKAYPETLPGVTCYRKLVDGETKAFMFSPQFTCRPGQADLHHTELWQSGVPLLLDAGTYQYNADSPWQNALAQTKVHNTLTIKTRDQMTKAGRFLWLDWPEVNWKDNSITPEIIAASHDGYRRRYGVFHERMVEKRGSQRWRVCDQISAEKPASNSLLDICVHWLLPLSVWEITRDGSLTVGKIIQIRSRYTTDSDRRFVLPEYQVIQGGKIMAASPGWSTPTDNIANLGWYSPTYGTKEPAISYRVLYRSKAPITIQTDFIVC